MSHLTTPDYQNVGLELVLPITLGVVLFLLSIVFLIVLIFKLRKNKDSFKKAQQRPRIKREDIRIVVQEQQIKSFPAVAMKIMNENKTSYHTKSNNTASYNNTLNKNNEKFTNAKSSNDTKKAIKLPTHAINHKIKYGVNKPNDVFFDSNSKWQAGQLARQAHNLKKSEDITGNVGKDVKFNGDQNSIVKPKVSPKSNKGRINELVAKHYEVESQGIKSAQKKCGQKNYSTEKNDIEAHTNKTRHQPKLNFNHFNQCSKTVNNTTSPTTIDKINNNNTNNRNRCSNGNMGAIYSLSKNLSNNNSTENNIHKINDDIKIYKFDQSDSTNNTLRLGHSKEQTSNDYISIGGSSREESDSSYGVVGYDENLRMPKIFNTKNTDLLEEIDNRLKYKREIMNNNNEGYESSEISDKTNLTLSNIENSDVYSNFDETDKIKDDRHYDASVSVDKTEAIIGYSNQTDDDDYQLLPCDVMHNRNNKSTSNASNTVHHIKTGAINEIFNSSKADLSREISEDLEETIGFECVVRYSYKAQYDDDISITTGEVLYVNQMLSNGWWRGVKGEEEGFFPGSHVSIKEEKKEDEKKSYDDLTERTKSSLIELSEAIKVEGLTNRTFEDESILRKKTNKSERFRQNTISKYFSKKFTNFTEAVKNGTVSEAFASKRINETKTDIKKLERVKSTKKAKGRSKAPEAPMTPTSRVSYLFGNLFQRKSFDTNSKITPTLEMSVVDSFDGILEAEKLKKPTTKGKTLQITHNCKYDDDVYANLSQYNAPKPPRKPDRSNCDLVDYNKHFKTQACKPQVPSKSSRLTTSLTNLNQEGLSVSKSTDGLWSSQLDINKPSYKPQPPQRPSNTLKPNNRKTHNENLTELVKSSHLPNKPTRTKKPSPNLETKEFSFTKPDIKFDTWSVAKKNNTPNILRSNLSFEDELKLRLNRNKV